MSSPTLRQQKGHTLSFPCTNCQKEVPLPLLALEKQEGKIACPHCQQKYAFSDPALLSQLQKFEALCRQIHASEDILSNTSIGVDVGNHQVQIPFKLLLTRFNAHLKLCLGQKEITIAFRCEPAEVNNPF